MKHLNTTAALLTLALTVVGLGQEAESDGFYNESESTVEQSHTIAFVLFNFNSADLTAESDSILTVVADSLKNDTAGIIEIAGHTDNTGDSEYNQKLSQQRAEAVKDALVTKGVSPERLRVLAHGMDRPIAENSSLKSRRLNRRVTIYRTE